MSNHITPEALFTFASNTGALYPKLCAAARFKGQLQLSAFHRIARGEAWTMYKKECGPSIIHTESFGDAARMLQEYYVRHVAEIDGA